MNILYNSFRDLEFHRYNEMRSTSIDIQTTKSLLPILKADDKILTEGKQSLISPSGFSSNYLGTSY